MKALQGTILATATKQMEQANGYIRLIEFTLPTTPKTVARLAAWDRDVSYDTTSAGVPLTWKKFPIALGDFRETRQGDLPQIQVGISNVTTELMGYVDRYAGLIGESFRIRTVKADALSDLQASILFVAEFIACECDEDSILFTLGLPSLNREIFPARRELSQCSVIRFGDDECGYQIPSSPTEAIGGGFSTCGRSLGECRTRGLDEAARGFAQIHPLRFNGRPGLVSGNS